MFKVIIVYKDGKHTIDQGRFKDMMMSYQWAKRGRHARYGCIYNVNTNEIINSFDKAA